MMPGLTWIAIGLVTALTVGLLLLPLLRRARDAAQDRAHDLAVYRDQLSELQRDLDRGLLEPEQAAAARLEIERRMLRAGGAPGADASEPTPAAGPGPARGLALVVAMLVPAGALLVYLSLGAPELPDVAFSARTAVPGQQAESAEFARLAEQLAVHLEQQPDDPRGWMMLGRAYLLLGREADSLAALRRGVAAAGGREAAPPDLLADLGEALVLAEGGIVTPEAGELFEHAARDPGQVKARHYLATERAQRGDFRGALALWRGIELDSPADAPWLPALRAQIGRVAAELSVDPASVAPERPSGSIEAEPAAPGAPPPAAVEAAARMSPEEREAFIRGMVERLAGRLAAQPDDAEGWARLGRAYTVLGDPVRAKEAFGKAAAIWRGEIERLPAGSPERRELEERLLTIEGRS